MSSLKIQEFTENASPDNWLKYADELRRTAAILWKAKSDFVVDFNSITQETKSRPFISRPFMFVAGLSLENALKAYIVSLGPSLINTGVLDKKLHEHNLIKLSHLCIGLTFDESEMELMSVLSEAIPYWGRYPIPRHFEHIKTETIVDDNINDMYKSLFERLFAATLDKIGNGWDAGNGVSFDGLQYHDYE